MEVNYRSYQKVLNISLKPKTPCARKPTTTNTTSTTTTKKVNKPKRDESQIKRRTKTGCLTCRKRKKKCDEDKVNGKCQACTRNFLDCCWPDPATIKPKGKTHTPKSEPAITRSTKCDINYLLQPEPQPQPQPEPVRNIQQATPPATPPKVYMPYPSPTLSPVFEETKPSRDVSFLALPPMYNTNYKLQSKDSNIRAL
ncbi:CZF1 Zinc finger protein 1 [Candida maltosa Xu316]